MTRIRPRAVVFDYGNVLSAPQGAAEVEAMASILNVAVDLFRSAYWKFRLSYDEAALDPSGYWNAVAQTLSKTLTASQIETLIETDSRGWAYPAPIVPQWARDIRSAGLKTGLLSNMPASVRDYVTRCDWLPPFDHQTFSCDLSIAKPAAEIYLACLSGLGVDPSDVLFLDDRPENVHAAEMLGMHAILYTTAEQAARDLAHRFDIPVPLIATVYENNAEDQ